MINPMINSKYVILDHICLYTWIWRMSSNQVHYLSIQVMIHYAHARTQTCAQSCCLLHMIIFLPFMLTRYIMGFSKSFFSWQNTSFQWDLPGLYEFARLGNWDYCPWERPGKRTLFCCLFLWNNLPPKFCPAPLLGIFKRSLKTWLFRPAFPELITS